MIVMIKIVQINCIQIKFKSISYFAQWDKMADM